MSDSASTRLSVWQTVRLAWDGICLVGYFLYLILRFALRLGQTWLNLCLLVVTLVYAAVFGVGIALRGDKTMRVTAVARHVNKYLRIFVLLLNVVALALGTIAAGGRDSAIELLFAFVYAAFLLLQIAIDATVWALTRKIRKVRQARAARSGGFVIDGTPREEVSVSQTGFRIVRRAASTAGAERFLTERSDETRPLEVVMDNEEKNETEQSAEQTTQETGHTDAQPAPEETSAERAARIANDAEREVGEAIDKAFKRVRAWFSRHSGSDDPPSDEEK